MKKLSNTASPFLMLLVPLFLLAGILTIHLSDETPAQKQKAATGIQIPNLKPLVGAVIR